MRRSLLGLALLAGSLGVVGTHPAEARPVPTSAYALRARADALGIELVAKDAPVVSIGGGQVTFLTPSSAQAELDALGSSRAFASAPYPGELVVSLPGTVNGVGAGTFPPVPSYPFYAASAHPSEPEAFEDVGPYSLRATSADDASEATARLGISTTPPKVSSASGHAKVSTPSSGPFVAEAEAEIAPFTIADVLTVGEVRSTARVEYDPTDAGRAPVKRSSLAFGTMAVAGVQVGLTEKGLEVQGSAVPVDPSALVAVLSAAGILLEYLPAVETDASITSASVRITYTENFPTAGDTTVRFVLGQVSATADRGGPLDGATGGVLSPPSPGSVVGGTTGSFTPGVPGTPGVAATPGRPAAAPLATSRPVPSAAHLTDVWTFFLVLVAGAIAALSGARWPGRPRNLDQSTRQGEMA
jgi:hypothetical protein